MASKSQYLYQVYRYALVICRMKPLQKGVGAKYLTIQESNGKWWIPGGKVELSQTFYQAALREARQESGLNIELKGIIRVDSNDNILGKKALRTVFYAQPTLIRNSDSKGQQYDISRIKSSEDHESKRAQFKTLDEIEKLQSEWRGREIYDFPRYLQDGGSYYPLSVFKQGFSLKERMI